MLDASQQWAPVFAQALGEGEGEGQVAADSGLEQDMLLKLGV